MSHVPVTGTKVCRGCGVEKDVAEFRAFAKYGDPDRRYRRARCWDCEAQYARQWRLRNPGYHAERSRRYRAL